MNHLSTRGSNPSLPGRAVQDMAYTGIKLRAGLVNTSFLNIIHGRGMRRPDALPPRD